MIKLISSWAIIFALIISTSVTAGYAKERNNERGIGATLTDKGFGIRISYNRSKSLSSMFTSEFEIISVKGKNELSGQIFNPFTGRYERFKVGDENLLLMPLMFGYRKNLWHDQIANNFQPYIQFSAGPVLAFDLKEKDPFATVVQEDVGFFEQFSKGKAYYTVGTSISGGAVIKTSKNSFVNVSVNYSLIDYGRDLDRRRALGGLALRVELGSWLK